MKKLLFSFVMMLALVIVAGNAMAALGDKFNPFPGGTYTYTLPYTLANAGGVTLTATAGMTVGTTTPTGITSGGSAVSLIAGSGNVVIPITYSTSATGTQTISIVIKDNVSGCSNNIHLDVTMAAIPTISLAVTGVADFCQNLKALPNSNEDASIGAATNTFVFTVTPTITPVAGSTYDFKFDLNSYVIGATAVTVQRTSGTGTATPATAVGSQIVVTGASDAQQFTVSFATTTGVATKAFTGTASAGTLHVSGGGATYSSSNASSTVNVKAMPTIGAFN